jgi:hypothetical protein
MSKPTDTPLERFKKRVSADVHRAQERGTLPRQVGGRTLWVTDQQFETVGAAIRRVRELESESKRTTTEGQALEMMAADFLAGSGWPGDESS